MLGLKRYSIGCNKCFKPFQFMKQFRLIESKLLLFLSFFQVSNFIPKLEEMSSRWSLLQSVNQQIFLYFSLSKEKKKERCNYGILHADCITYIIPLTLDTSVASGLRAIVNREVAQQVTLPTQPSAVFFVDWWSECSKLMPRPAGFVRELCGC